MLSLSSVNNLLPKTIFRGRFGNGENWTGDGVELYLGDFVIVGKISKVPTVVCNVGVSDL